jgi:hypothetical protein
MAQVLIPVHIKHFKLCKIHLLWEIRHLIWVQIQLSEAGHASPAQLFYIWYKVFAKFQVLQQSERYKRTCLYLCEFIKGEIEPPKLSQMW